MKPLIPIKNPKLGKFVNIALIILNILWVILPDLIPGPIDDFFALVVAIREYYEYLKIYSKVR